MTLAIANAWKRVGTTQTEAITLSATYGTGTPTAANLLVIGINSYGGSSANHAITDNQTGNNYVKIAEADVASAPSHTMLSLWYCKNIAVSGAFTLTVDGGASGTYTTGIVHEVSGASTSAPFTAGEYSSVTGLSTVGTYLMPSTAFSNETAASIFFALLYDGELSSSCTFTPNGTGTVGTWNLYNTTYSQEIDSNSYQPMSVVNIVVSSSASTGHVWVASGDSIKYGALQAAFHNGVSRKFPFYRGS